MASVHKGVLSPRITLQRHRTQVVVVLTTAVPFVGQRPDSTRSPANCPFPRGLRRRTLPLMNWSPDANSLRSRVAIVAGATRGAGRGIAAGLGEAGATVICTGRSTRSAGSARSDYNRPETIEET